MEHSHYDISSNWCKHVGGRVNHEYIFLFELFSSQKLTIKSKSFVLNRVIACILLLPIPVSSTEARFNPFQNSDSTFTQHRTSNMFSFAKRLASLCKAPVSMQFRKSCTTTYFILQWSLAIAYYLGALPRSLSLVMRVSHTVYAHPCNEATLLRL